MSKQQYPHCTGEWEADTGEGSAGKKAQGEGGWEEV